MENRSIVCLCVSAFIVSLFVVFHALSYKRVNPYFFQNIEALANDEGGSGIYTCHKDYFYKEGYSVRDCKTCTMQTDRKASFWSLPYLCK